MIKIPVGLIKQALIGLITHEEVKNVSDIKFDLRHKKILFLNEQNEVLYHMDIIHHQEILDLIKKSKAAYKKRQRKSKT